MGDIGIIILSSPAGRILRTNRCREIANTMLRLCGRKNHADLNTTGFSIFHPVFLTRLSSSLIGLIRK